MDHIWGPHIFEDGNVLHNRAHAHPLPSTSRSLVPLQVGVIVSRSWSRRQGLALSAVVAAVHLGYLLYLRFAYHQIYEALAEAVTP